MFALKQTKLYAKIIDRKQPHARMPERLQKILAQSGYGSRRACEDFISAGRVRVNGQIASLSQKADPAIDKITVDGKPVAAAESLIYIALYKPRNVLSAVEKEKGNGCQIGARPLRFCRLQTRAAMTKTNLSARAYHRILKLARTIANLAEALHCGRLKLMMG